LSTEYIYGFHMILRYYSLYAIMKSCDIHKKTKIRLYQTLIRTVLTHGCETWKLTKKSEDDMNSFERKIYQLESLGKDGRMR
jgi:hypothetical protein